MPTSAASPAVRRSRRVAVTAGGLVLIALATGQQIWAIHERTELEIGRSTTVAAEAAAAYVGQVFGAVTLALQSIDNDPTSPRIVLHGTPAEIRATLRRAQTVSPVIQGLAVVGTDGRVAVSATPSPAPSPDLTDRPYFAAHRDGGDPGLRIDRPVVGRPNNVVGIPVSMRLETVEGAFAGLVAARLDPRSFSSFFARLGADAIALVDAGGHLYARFPEVDLMAAEARPVPGLERGGRFTVPTPGRERRDGYAVPVAGTGLSIRASHPHSLFVETWLRRAAAPALIGLVAAGLVLVASERVRRRDRRVVALIDARVAGEKDARREADRFREVARTKSDFLAHMSHEIRTPLNAIIGFSDVIASDAMKLGAPPRYREYAADIRFSADHLLGVINRILDMSKIEAGKWQLSLGPVRAEPLLATVRQLAVQRAEKEGVRLEIAEPGEGVVFTGDERTLVQLLLNLAINAIKFAGDDRTVTLSCTRLAGGFVDFGVTDRGPGMTPADAERALRPFETADSDTGRGRADTGLGLPLARMFAELHGGTLTIETAPGKGTTVRVRLPEAGPAADAARPAA